MEKNKYEYFTENDLNILKPDVYTYCTYIHIL